MSKIEEARALLKELNVPSSSRLTSVAMSFSQWQI